MYLFILTNIKRPFNYIIILWKCPGMLTPLGAFNNILFSAARYASKCAKKRDGRRVNNNKKSREGERVKELLLC